MGLLSCMGQATLCYLPGPTALRNLLGDPGKGLWVLTPHPRAAGFLWDCGERVFIPSGLPRHKGAVNNLWLPSLRGGLREIVCCVLS